MTSFQKSFLALAIIKRVPCGAKLNNDSSGQTLFPNSVAQGESGDFTGTHNVGI